MEIQTPDGLGLPDLSTIEGYQPDLLSRSLTITNALLINPDLQPPVPTSRVSARRLPPRR